MLWLYKYTLICHLNIQLLCLRIFDGYVGNSKMSNYVWEVCESHIQRGWGDGAIVPFYRRIFYRNTGLGDGTVCFLGSFVIVVFC